MFLGSRWVGGGLRRFPGISNYACPCFPSWDVLIYPQIPDSYDLGNPVPEETEEHQGRSFESGANFFFVVERNMTLDYWGPAMCVWGGLTHTGNGCKALGGGDCWGEVLSLCLFLSWSFFFSSAHPQRQKRR